MLHLQRSLENWESLRYVHSCEQPLDSNSFPLCLRFEKKSPAKRHLAKKKKKNCNPTHIYTQTVRTPIERHYAYWQCDRLAQRDPQTSRSHNEMGQEHWGLWRKGWVADGRSHWNMSVLMQPTEDVLNLAVTKAMWRMATADAGQRVQLSCSVSRRQNEWSGGG